MGCVGCFPFVVVAATRLASVVPALDPMTDETLWRQAPDGHWQYRANDGQWYDHRPEPAPTGHAPGAATNGFAIASLVLSILWILGLGAILAVIFAFVALRQIRERGQTGRGLAIAGMILGWIGIFGLVLFIVFGVIVTNAIRSGGLSSGTTTISVTGDQSAQTIVTVEMGGSEQQHTGVLPYSQTISGRPFVVSVVAQSQDSSSSASVTCTITATGMTPVTNTSSGAFATVTCAATPGG